MPTRYYVRAPTYWHLTPAYIVRRQDPSDPSTFPPPVVLLSVPAVQAMSSGENGHGTKTTGKNHTAEYSGLPLV